MCGDRVDVVMDGLPAEPCEDLPVVRDDAGDVARTARAGMHGEVAARQPLHRADGLQHGVSAPVAAIECEAGIARPKLLQGEVMRLDEIAHMDEVALRRAVAGGIVGAVDGQPVAQAERGLAGDLEQMRRAARRVAGTPLRIGAGDVEIAQHAAAQPVCAGDVGEHPLAHQLRHAIGGGGKGRRALVHRVAADLAVDGCGGGEDDVGDAGRVAALDQGQRRAGVVAVVFFWTLDGFGNGDRAGEMQHRIDRLAGQIERTGKGVSVSDIAAQEGGGRRCRPFVPALQAVENDDALACIEQAPRHVAADVPCATGYKNRHRSLLPMSPAARAAAVRASPPPPC